MKVSKSALGGKPREPTYVAIGALAIGWMSSVDLVQNFMRKVLFEICGVPRALEASCKNMITAGSAALESMGGFNFFIRLEEVDGKLRMADVYMEGKKIGPALLQRFFKECKARWMPLNKGYGG